MKMLIWKRVFSFALVFSCTLAPSISWGSYDELTYEKEISYQIEEREWHGDLSRLTFVYNLFVPGNAFQNGNVFVAFRLRSQPDTLWFLDQDGNWSMNNPGVTPPYYYTGKLAPVMRIPILRDPTDMSAFTGDGEFFVGWGFSEVSVAAAFQDMLDNGRVTMVWLVGDSQESRMKIILFSSKIGITYVVSDIN